MVGVASGCVAWEEVVYWMQEEEECGDDDVDVVCFDAWTAVACLAPTRLPCPVTVQLSTDGSDSTHWFAVTVTGD